MTNKVFTPGVVIDSPWLNDVNQATYNLLGNGQTVPTTKAGARDNLGIGSTYSFRNKLINAAGNVDQRKFNNPASNNTNYWYFQDRWRIPVANESVSWTMLANGFREWTTGANGIEQAIEGLNLEGGVYVLSWVGNAVAYINGGAIPNGGSVFIPVNQHAVLRFVGTFSQPQFEKGTVPTPFEYRPYTYELMLCQRYFFSYFGATVYGIGQAAATTTVAAVFVFPTAMRTTPLLSANQIAVTSASATNITANTATLGSASTQVATVNLSVTSGLVAGNASLISGVNANAFLKFDAEL